MSVVILTEKGLNQSEIAQNYANTFTKSGNDIYSKLQSIANIMMEFNKRTDSFISQQSKILQAFGGIENLRALLSNDRTSEIFTLEDLKKTKKEQQLSQSRKHIQETFQESLKQEQEFQDYMIDALSMLESLTGKEIPANKFYSLISTLKNFSKNADPTLSNDKLLEALETAQEESTSQQGLLEEKYHYLRLILDQKRSNPLSIKKTDSGWELAGLENGSHQEQVLKKILPLMDELIEHFDSITSDKKAIVTKLSRWRTSTRKNLAKNYAEIIKELSKIPEDILSSKNKEKLRKNLVDAIATYISKDTNRTDYTITASLRGNLAEIERAVTVTPVEPIPEQIINNPQIIPFLAENIGHKNKRKANIMIPIVFSENNEQYYCKINTQGKLTQIKNRKELSEGELLLTDISKTLSEVDGKTDRLYGYNIISADKQATNKYYIAYSDKFKEYSSLINLPVIGNTNKKTGMNSAQPLNSNMGLFSSDELSKGLLFAILNKSYSSYLSSSMPSINELENFVSNVFFDLSFDPKGLQEAISTMYPQIELSNSNTLYIQDLGGGFILPVFQVMEAMNIQSHAISNYGEIISDVVTSSLFYGPAPDEKTIMKMLGQAQPSDRWEWVASYIASTIKILVELHLEQLFQVFGIMPLK